MRSIQQTLMRSMTQLFKNSSLKNYALIEELNNAVHLLYEAKRAGSKVDLHLMQTNLFDASASEIYSEAEKMLAKVLENLKDKEIRSIFEIYNTEAEVIESGQQNLFGEVLQKSHLLNLILSKFGYGTEQTESTRQDEPSPQSYSEITGNRSGRSEISDQREQETGEKGPSGESIDDNTISAHVEAEAAKVDATTAEAKKEAYEGARHMPGMEDLSKTMDSYSDVLAFDDFENPKNINNDEQGERSTETIEAETAVVETASEAIERESENVGSESENVGSDKQRAGEVIEKATEQIEKAEKLFNEIDKKLANLKLAGKEYTTEGILADYPIDILAKGPIKKDATSFVKAVAKITGLEHDTNSKGKAQIVNVNIAPAGGDATFILWGKKSPDYGVYVSIPYKPEYARDRNDYDNYKVDGSIIWRVTTREHKYRGLGNQRMKADVTAQEMAEILLNGLNSELRFRKLEQETNDVEKAPEKVKKTKLKTENIMESKNNMQPLFHDIEEVEPINTNQNEEVKLQDGTTQTERGRQQSNENDALGGRTGNESKRTDRNGVDRRDTTHTADNQTGSRRLPDSPESNQSGDVKKNTRNNRSKRGTDYAPTSPQCSF